MACLIFSAVLRTCLVFSTLFASVIPEQLPSRREFPVIDGKWIAAMARVHERFRGRPRTFALFGDSISVSRAFWSPLARTVRGMDSPTRSALARVRRYQRPECWAKWKGPRYGNDGGTTIRWADENIETWLHDLEPESALLAFGTNDLHHLDVNEFAGKTQDVVVRCLDKGTVVLLSTLPPKSDDFEKSAQFSESIRQIGRELQVPVIDYFAEIVRRRPEDWDGALPQFRKVRGDDYQVPTLIARDRKHPSNPRAFQAYDEDGLSKNGYILRNWMVLNAYAEVIDMVLDPGADELRKAVAFYASFDEEVRGDLGGGQLTPDTRYNHPTEVGKFDFEKGFNHNIFRIAKDKGISGGALEATEPLPRNGRIFFPAKGNLPWKAGGWSTAVSFWCNTDPNELIKAPFCDPVQITQKGANNGGLWFDFNKSKPRDSRHGAFRASSEGKPAHTEDEPDAPMVRVPGIAWKAGEWHHVVLNSRNFDTGRADAISQLYIDGKLIGELKNRDIAMHWDLDKTGIYVAVNYVGLMDELAIFSRALSADEIQLLFSRPGVLGGLKSDGRE